LAGCHDSIPRRSSAQPGDADAIGLTLGMKTYGKRAEKLLSRFHFYIFSGNMIMFRKKNGIINGRGYTEIRKKINTDEEPEN
jgi:hypothetical protein